MGAAVRITRLDLSAAALRRMAGRMADSDVVRRLLALALVLEGQSREAAAKATGMDRQTLRDWVHRYNADGVDGLVNGTSSGRPPFLSPDQEAQIAQWVSDGPDIAVDGVVRWRRIDLAAKIQATYGVTLAERSVGAILHRLGMRRLSVRPQHPQQDPQAIEMHKKTSTTWSPARPPSTRAASPSRSGGRTRPGSANRAP